jgi:hypothetical protein
MRLMMMFTMWKRCWDETDDDVYNVEEVLRSDR